MNDITTPKGLNTEAFTDILVRFQWPLYAFLRGIISDQEQAHDLVQDVFCDAWRAVQRVASPFDGQGDEETIRRWLFHTGPAGLTGDHLDVDGHTWPVHTLVVLGALAQGWDSSHGRVGPPGLCSLASPPQSKLRTSGWSRPSAMSAVCSAPPMTKTSAGPRSGVIQPPSR